MSQACIGMSYLEVAATYNDSESNPLYGNGKLQLSQSDLLTYDGFGRNYSIVQGILAMLSEQDANWQGVAANDLPMVEARGRFDSAAS